MCIAKYKLCVYTLLTNDICVNHFCVGVIITLANITNLVNWWCDFFQVNANDRILLFSSMSFITSLRQYLPTLCAGGTVVIPKSSVEFESAITNMNVNKLVCTPSALASLDINNVTKDGRIEMVQVAGEAPQMSTMTAWKEKTKKLFIGLGPTELCAHALCGEFDGEKICIGNPARNVRVYIVDPSTGLQTPVNVVGELWVSGMNVSGGYLNRKEETNKYFSIDPDTGCRLYKTGDLARRLSDGRIQFIGRSDKQMKVNGFRIEPGDIINAMPTEVNNAHVVVENSRLVLYVAPLVDKDAVLTLLRDKLPTYMCPSLIISVEQFPLNKNKKLDVNALVQIGRATMIEHPETDHRGLSGVRKDESSQLEDTIRLVWAEILKVDPEGIHTDHNFFEKGGTSLSTVIASRKLSKEFQMDISVQDVFAHQTINSLVEAITKSCDIIQNSGDPTPLTFLSGGRDSMHPLIFGVLQAIGLAFMSIIVGVPIFGTTFLSIRSFV